MEKTTLEEYLDHAAISIVNSHKGIRIGQIYFNVLYDCNVELAKNIQGSAHADPFYDDRNLTAFFDYIKENW